MRACRRLLPVLAWVLLFTTGASAGVYNPADLRDVVLLPKFIDSPGKPQFRDVIIALRTIPVTSVTGYDTPLRQRYVLVDELAGRVNLAPLKRPEDKLQVSAVLIRRLKSKQAEDYLRPLALRETENFLLQSNLATALHQQGKLQEAWDVLNETLRRKKYWPEDWTGLSEAQRNFLVNEMGWNEGPFTFYRTCDTYYLKLLKLRLREKLAKKDPKAPQTVDKLFDDGKDPPTPIPFLSADGRFEAGKIAPVDRERLKKISALAIVQQLVAWQPDDLRLYWLLGEVYNAQGDDAGIRAAHQIFGELLKAGFEGEGLEKKYGTLQQALENRQMEEDRRLQSGVNKSEREPEEANRIDWRTVGVSFGAGFVVAIFALWQVREIRRRQAGKL
jgi:hypothetical protein